MYTIDPLYWEEEGKLLKAETAFGSYEVYKLDDPVIPHNKWTWTYCFDEWYDEGTSYTATKKRAMEEANEHWKERISRNLTEVEK